MKEKHGKTGKRLRIIPFVLGIYGSYLGFGLTTIGLAEIKEGIGIVRFLIGLGMAGFGLLGIWDGVRDLVRPGKKSEKPTAIQFILTDTSGNRSSNVTIERLREQLKSLMENEGAAIFKLEILPPLTVQDLGKLNQIFCLYHNALLLTAFFDRTDGEYETYHMSLEQSEAEKWFETLFTGNPDFSGWEKTVTSPPWEESSCREDEEDSLEATDGSMETDGLEKTDDLKAADGSAETAGLKVMDDSEATDGSAEANDLETVNGSATADGSAATDNPESTETAKTIEPLTSSEKASFNPEAAKAWGHQLLTQNQKGMAHWRQLLVIFGESWHDEHKFFSVRDVELAVEGVHEGKYQKVVLEWGVQAFDLFPGVQNELMVIWCTNNTGRGDTRFLAREGTVTQVKFWLVHYMDRGFFEETSGWVDITAQIENEKKKGEKKHGKVF